MQSEKLLPLSLSSENHLFQANCTKKEQNACWLCKDLIPALHTAKRWIWPVAQWLKILVEKWLYVHEIPHQNQACCKWMPPVLKTGSQQWMWCGSIDMISHEIKYDIINDDQLISYMISTTSQTKYTPNWPTGPHYMISYMISLKIIWYHIWYHI